jgi:peptide-methionine (S)-S-oxide reductase
MRERPFSSRRRKPASRSKWIYGRGHSDGSPEDHHRRALRRLALAALVAAAAVLATGSCASASGGAGAARATFAGGCFWCVEEAFEKVPGVVAAVSGYAGGTAPGPTHENVSAGASDHVEAIEVTYDPARVDYATLLTVFWRNVDPLDAGGQFCDRGRQYRSAIFVASDEERRLAEDSKRRVAETLHAPVVTEILPAGRFHAAEPLHQDFYKKNPAQYHQYKDNCGREKRLKQLWGDSPAGGER